MTNNRFRIAETPLVGVKAVMKTRLADQRDCLQQPYCQADLAAARAAMTVEQINDTVTRERGAIRRLHYQHVSHTKDSYVAVLRGEIFDLAVDLRRGSPISGHLHGEILVGNARSLPISHGCAHGFQTLSNDCELVYLHPAVYRCDVKDTVNAFDPAIAIH